MTEKLRRLWRQLTTSRHTAWLEAEIERLRAECVETRRQNWALVNSLVTTAGAPLPQEVLRHAEVRGAQASVPAPASERQPRGRKSWQQLARALEIESAREFRREAQT